MSNENLEFVTIANKYKDLLHIDNDNAGDPTSLVSVLFGDGNSSTLKLSETRIEADFGGGLLTKPIIKGCYYKFLDNGDRSRSIST